LKRWISPRPVTLFQPDTFPTGHFSNMACDPPLAKRANVRA